MLHSGDWIPLSTQGTHSLILAHPLDSKISSSGVQGRFKDECIFEIVPLEAEKGRVLEESTFYLKNPSSLQFLGIEPTE